MSLQSILHDPTIKYITPGFRKIQSSRHRALEHLGVPRSVYIYLSNYTMRQILEEVS